MMVVVPYNSIAREELIFVKQSVHELAFKGDYKGLNLITYTTQKGD